MAFSLPNNPYFSSAPTSSSSLSDVAEFRQNLVSRIFGRPQDYDLSSLTQSPSPELLRRPDVSNSRKPLCAPNNLLNSPGWFQHALASSLQMGLLSLPRYMLKDICLPPLPPHPLNMRLPRTPNVSSAPYEQMLSDVKPKIPSKPPPLRTEHFRSSSSSCSSLNDCESSFPSSYHRQPTVRPTLMKRQTERPKMNWCSNNNASNRPVSVEPQDTGTLVPSLIDGEVIMGFNVWGEKRLCLPHLFRFVLHDVDLQIIDKACTKLQIACTTCTPAQLSLLHSRQILPRTVGSCGLIRKSDAERLTKYIRHQSMCLEGGGVGSEENPTLSKSPVNVHTKDEYEGNTTCKDQMRQMSPASSTDTTKSTNSSLGNKQAASSSLLLSSSSATDRLDSGQDENQPEFGCKAIESNVIPVIHECFGRQLGLIYPDLYKEPYSKCIKCVTCCRYFSPEQFVGHTHTVTEVDNLNHWGFDSTNWRCYLRLYTGRRLNLNSTPILANINSEPEASGKTNSKEPVFTGDAHRRLEEFKIKFAQPIKLPPSLSAALRSVGLCASVAPFSTGSNAINTQPTSQVSEKNESIKGSTTTTTSAPAPPPPQHSQHQQQQQQGVPMRSNKLNDQTLSTNTTVNSTVNPSPPCNVMLPQLTLRRLWAPNDGRIKLPPPPKLLTNSEIKLLPEKFQTGPPLLLHSHRVVTQDAAHHYDRDFIPNVCLKPFKSTTNDCQKLLRPSSSRKRRHRRQHHQQQQHSPPPPSTTTAYYKQQNDEYHDSTRNSTRSRSSSEEYSSGSRSSRTRSSSTDSTTSSRCSCDKSSIRQMNSSRLHHHNHHRHHWITEDQNKSLSPDPNHRNNSIHEISNSNNLYDTKYAKRNFSYTSSMPCTHRLRKTRSLSRMMNKCNQRRRRTSSCPGVFLATTSTTTNTNTRQVNSMNALQCSNDRHNKRKLSNSISAFQTCRKKANTCQIDRNGMKQRSKAMAAARAAQGAASRTGPGLWARHFVNLRNSDEDSMKLPNARRSVSQTSDAQNNCYNPMNTTPVLVTNPMKNSLPAAVLALEAIWADLVRLINEYTIAIESRCGVDTARQRLFEQFISMQTCYATHIAALMDENQKLHEKLTQAQSQLLLCQPQLQSFMNYNNNNNNNSNNSNAVSSSSLLPVSSSTMQTPASVPMSALATTVTATAATPSTSASMASISNLKSFQPPHHQQQQHQQQQYHFDCKSDSAYTFNRSDETGNAVMSHTSNNNNIQNININNNLTHFPRNEFSSLANTDAIRNVSCVNKLKPMSTSDEIQSKTVMTSNTPSTAVSVPASAPPPQPPISAYSLHKHASTSNDYPTGGLHSSSRSLSTTSSSRLLSLSSSLKRKNDSLDDDDDFDFETHRSTSTLSSLSNNNNNVQERLEANNNYPDILQATTTTPTTITATGASTCESRESPSEGGGGGEGHSQSSSTPTASETDGFPRDPGEEDEDDAPNPCVGEATDSSVWLKSSLTTIDKSSTSWELSHQNNIGRSYDGTTAKFIPQLHDSPMMVVGNTTTMPKNHTIYTHQPKKRRTLNIHLSATAAVASAEAVAATSTPNINNNNNGNI
ncbi:unnamed protein product [Trichobilharzia szidati]|nr:unnamed protein product [Trichobilharzia szidati]CAH8843654.1 unnamed protein product [Trichobilharzia szidati]